MTYQETLAWMFSQLPMYQLRGKTAYTAKLDNILSFTEQLGHPETRFRSIHVAGTNGKGSCSHMLASILQEAGYQVGLYTSPHLKDFRERIKLNGQPVSKAEVTEFIGKHRAFLETNMLSFFEMSVGMAFDFFADQAVDIAIIEVGLGGRLDSTNIITPEVALITNIGLDHTDMLGKTLSEITMEKAGIIKQGVPVVISEWQEEVAPIFERIARERNAKLVFADRVIRKEYTSSLKGLYQKKNIKGVVATLAELRNFQVGDKHIRDGLRRVVDNTGLLGRWQVVRKNPMVIYDTAHNSEGLAITLAQLKRQKYEQLHIVLGFVKEKDLRGILPLFPKNAHYYFCRPDIPRGLDARKLESRATKIGLHGKRYLSVPLALEAALDAASEKDVIFVGGSTFVVADVL